MAIIPTWFPSQNEDVRAACSHQPRPFMVARNQFSGLIREEREPHRDSCDEARIVKALEALDNTRSRLTIAFGKLTRTLRRASTGVQQRYDQFHRAGGVTAEQYRAFLRGEFDQQIPVIQNKHLRCVAHKPA